jgi:lysophospholipase L1-like esterase
MRFDQMRTVPRTPGAIVFLGDSITEQGLWNEWFPNRVILNRGIGGETSAQILQRVDAIDAPRAVFLLAGTNDFPLGYPPQAVADNLTQIVDRLHASAPLAKVIVQSILPRQKPFAREIVQTNLRLRQMTAERAQRSHFLDLWPILATGEGTLNREYTGDGLHLNGAGYRKWVEALRPLIDAVPEPD